MPISQLMANPLPGGKTGVLIVSPTRELASQIAEEAKVLATFHKLTVQVWRCSRWMAALAAQHAASVAPLMWSCPMGPTGCVLRCFRARMVAGCDLVGLRVVLWPGSVLVKSSAHLTVTKASEHSSMQMTGAVKDVSGMSVHECCLQVMVGGTNQNRDLSTFRSAVPNILIATPGRLNDNLQQVRWPRWVLDDCAAAFCGGTYGFNLAVSCASPVAYVLPEGSTAIQVGSIKAHAHEQLIICFRIAIGLGTCLCMARHVATNLSVRC